MLSSKSRPIQKTKHPSRRAAKCMLMVLNRAQKEDSDTAISYPHQIDDTLTIVRHWVLYNAVGFEGCVEHDYFQTIKYMEPKERKSHTDSEYKKFLTKLVSKCRSWRVLEYLVSLGADSSVHSSKAIVNAVKSGCRDMVMNLEALYPGCLRLVSSVEDAAKARQWEMLDLLLNKPEASRKKDRVQSKLDNALTDACCTGTQDDRNALVQRGAKITNISDKIMEKWIKGNDINVIDWAVQCGWKIKASSQPLELAIKCGTKEMELHLIKRHGVTLSTACGGMLRTALYEGNLERAAYYLEHGINDSPAMKWAVEIGNESAVRYLLAHNPDRAKRDSGNMFRLACKLGKIDLVHCFVEYGADANLAFEEAVIAKQYDVALALLGAGADPCANEYSALRRASAHGRTDFMEASMDTTCRRANQDIEQHGHGGGSRTIHGLYCAMLDMAAKNGHSSIISSILSQAGPEFIVPFRDNLLYLASHEGHVNVVCQLIGLGAHATTKAVQSACSNGHCQVVKVLVQCGADVHSQNDYAVRQAAVEGHLSVVKYIMSLKSRGDPTVPLYAAVQHDRISIVEFLVGVGADVHKLHACGWIDRWARGAVLEYLKKVLGPTAVEDTVEASGPSPEPLLGTMS